MLVREILTENLGIPKGWTGISFDDLDTASARDEMFKTKIEPILNAHCREIKKIYKSGDLIWRGVKDVERQPVFVTGVRTDRRPGYLNMTMHTLANQAITELGGKAHRGNSIFVTTKEYVAEDWGIPIIVLPPDGFDITYFKKYANDYFYNQLTELWELLKFDAQDLDKKSDEYYRTDGLEATKDLMKKMGISFSKSGVVSAMKNTTEFLIACDSYIGISDIFLPQIKKWAKN